MDWIDFRNNETGVACSPVRRVGIRASPARGAALWQNRRHLLRMRITAPLLSKAIR
ncbi:hypothetical protein BVI1335_1220074 [Burkholderia vietnamiensis]|nr:hypothetical protein BVI1335_1220074 [Burkholderia vietnamiensis]